jgi:uncharacterized protein with FMN-binding domain
MGSKIYVFKLNKILKTVAIAAVGIGGAILLISAIDNSKSVYVPGTYSTDIILHNNPVSVDVSVSKNEIIGITINNMSETAQVFYPTVSNCAAEIAQEVVEKQSTSIEVDEDYKYAGEIVLAAIDASLEKAKK